MFYLIYVSNATRPLTNEELHDILHVSRDANVQIEITGLLLYKESSFMQLLEGAERSVRALLDKITRDPRHYNVLTLQEGTTEGRHFPAWSMGFQHLERDDAVCVTRYTDFRDASLTGEEFQADPARSLKLLHLFREHV